MILKELFNEMLNEVVTADLEEYANSLGYTISDGAVCTKGDTANCEQRHNAIWIFKNNDIASPVAIYLIKENDTFTLFRTNNDMTNKLPTTVQGQQGLIKLIDTINQLNH